VLSVLGQAAMGMLKMSTLQTSGRRTFTFHGTLGKIIIWSGAVNILLAVWFWGWSAVMKTVMIALVVLTACFGTAWPTQEEQSKGQEETELLQR